DDPAERQHRDRGGAAADIDDHRGGRLGDRQPGTDRRGYRLLDQKNAPGTGAFRGLLDGAPLDPGGPRWHANDQVWAGKARTFAYFPEEVFDHLLRNLEIGDNAVAQGPDRLHRLWRAPQH